ncbi:MAG: TerB family tellurite resistance protein [Byssovorax sp.]
MVLFVLPLSLLVILVALALALAVSLARALRSAFLLRKVELQISPEELRPGEGMRVFARVLPIGQRPVTVRARLTCTLLDHAPRVLYENTHELAPVHDRPNEFAAFVLMPAYALRTGAVGGELSRLFSPDAHRLLVSWSVDFEVALAERPKAVLARASIPVHVPEGKALKDDRGYMDQLLVETCQAMHSDLVFNWMVRVAGADGTVVPAERQLLHEVLSATFGIRDPETADARIAVELKRDLSVDPRFLRRHLPEPARLSLYRFLYAMAMRDGAMHGAEHGFLLEVLDRFGLDPNVVRAVEGEVLRGTARDHAR